MLFGDPSMMKSQAYEIRFSECRGTSRTGKPCKSKPEIQKYIKDVQVDIWATFESMDFNQYEKMPTFVLQDIYTSSLLTYDIQPQNLIYLRKHTVETEDTWMKFGQIAHEGTFYQIGKLINRPEHIDKNDGVLMKNIGYLQAEEISHTRKIYCLIDLLGDLGGVTEVIMLMFGFFLYPISEHSYITRATQRLYLARTQDGKLFEKITKDDIDSKEYAQKIDKSLLQEGNEDEEKFRKNIRKHRVIKISFWDNLKLYITKDWSWEIWGKLWPKKDKLAKLYEKGQDAIESQLNLLKIMKSLKNIKILMRQTTMTQKKKQ